MEPPAFPAGAPRTLRAAPGATADLLLPLPRGTPPFQYHWSRAGASLDDRFKKSDDAGGVRLTVSAARTDDTGVYTLQASNAAGSDLARVRLEVSADEAPSGDDPPTFLRRLQDLTVKVGTRTRFLVEIISSTECKVTWYRNERRLMEAERISLVRDGHFWCAEVSAVSVDDAGRWTCSAENAGGRASCSAHLNVLVPKAYKRPEFVEELRALLTEQGTVSLECKVVGVPTPVLRWFKDSKEIKAGDVFALTANAEDPTSLGTYTCEAVNCMGRAYSSSKVHVVGSNKPTSVSLEPPPIFTKELESCVVHISSPLALACQLAVPPWPRQVVFYNKAGKLEPGDRYHVVEDGVGGYLVEVSSAEWCDEGEWKCVATSRGGRVGISTAYVTMEVPKNYRAPRFMENLQAVLTEEGLVSFECKVVGFPTPVLSWFKDGQELKPGDVYQLTGTNSLGSYCCIARNCMGQASSSAELTVEDIQNQLNEEEKLQLFAKNHAPKFLQGLKSVEAKIDEAFRFTVKVEIPPEPSVQWYRDSQPVDGSTRCCLAKEDRGLFHLDIQNLELLDQAEWKCIATNDFGHSVTSCFLKLLIPRHYKKPRFLENLQAILSEEGAVNLECKVIGVPQPVLKWYKDGEELKPGDIHRIISGQDGTCCLGTYTCEARNCMGIAASSASLLGFDANIKAKQNKTEEQPLQRNLSLSTIHEERTSQMYDTPVGDITLDDKGEISFSFDGKEVSVSLYETPDLTEEEALQIVEMYADQLSENVTEHNVVELPPLRFVKETSTSGNLLMEAIIIDVSPDYFVTPEEDLRTEADVEDISIADENAAPQLSLDTDLGGEDYLEKTMALLSEEKSDMPKKIQRKKSDSIKSGEDFYSLSREQSLSEDKKDDETQVSESFASAKSSAKMKSSKPSDDEFNKTTDITKTVPYREAQKHSAETEPSPVVKPKRERRGSRGSRRSSSGSEKSLSRSKDEPRKKLLVELDTVSPPIVSSMVTDSNRLIMTDHEFITKMINVSSVLSKVINDIQMIEKDIILKSELMSSAATASRSLEIINSLLTPLSEIHSVADATKETTAECKQVGSNLFTNLSQPLKLLQQSLTIIDKCIDVESDSRTLVKRTCVAFVQTCSNDVIKIMSELRSITSVEFLSTEQSTLCEVDVLSRDITNILQASTEVIQRKNLLVEISEPKHEEPSLETKHLRDTQRAVFDLRSPLNSLLCIAESAENIQMIDIAKVKHSDVILTDMSASIQDLQAALEQIESLSVKESTTSLHKYNTEIIEAVMESVLKLRGSFEQLSTETRTEEDKSVLIKALASIKYNLGEISAQIKNIENNIGTFDILQSENKLEVLQRMAQILIALENNLPNLEIIPEVKMHLDVFHKNLTKVLENVIESNDAKKYFTLIEICDAVNRVNNSVKNISSNNILALASLSNTLKIIEDYFIKNVFESELNCSILSNIADVLICVQETVNHADEISLQIDSEHLQEISTPIYVNSKAQGALEQIDHTIAAISSVRSIETTNELKNALLPMLETVTPILEELRRSIASTRPSAIESEEMVTDLSEMSLAQTLASPIYDLNQNITIINQMLIENIDSIKDSSDIILTVAQPLQELHTTLEIIQQDVISQYAENITTYEANENVANAVRNLQSCILTIQEQAGIEAIEEMSTLEDISGIKTTADTLTSDRLVLPMAEEVVIEQGLQSLNQDLAVTTTAQALQSLNEHITVFQTPEIMDALDSLSEVSDYSSLKSVALGLGELHAGIEEILHPLMMESSNELSNLVNSSKLVAIAEPMQELQQSLSVLEPSNIPVYEHILDLSTEKIHSVLETITQFKERLGKCIHTVFPAMEAANKTLEISNKVESLRVVCENLNDIIKMKKMVTHVVPLTKEVNALEQTVNDLLDATDVSKDIKIEKVKLITEKLYQNIASVQEEIVQFTPHTSESLCQEALMIQAIDEIESNIAVLESYEFVDLSKASDIASCSTPQLAIEFESESLMQMDDIVEIAVNVVQDSTQDTPVADLTVIEDFFKTCKNEFTILRYLMSKQLTHKKIIRILQEFCRLQNSINEFRSKRSQLKLSDDIDSYLTTFLVHADDCLKNVRESLIKIVQSQANILVKEPVQKLEDTKKALQHLPEGKISPQIAEVAKKFGEVIEAMKPLAKIAEKAIVEELKDSTITTKVEENKLCQKMEEIVIFLEEQSDVLSLDDDSKQILQKVLQCIQKHDEYRDAIGIGTTLIILKCLSECSDVLHDTILEAKPKSLVEHKIDDSALKAVLTETLDPLQALHNQLISLQEQILSGADEDSISIDIPSTESLVQTMSEIHKEIQQVESGIEEVDSKEISLIMEVDKEIHIIQDSIRAMENIPAAQIVKEISKPIDEIEKSLHVLLSSDKVMESKSKLSSDINSNINSLECALKRFIDIEVDLLEASGILIGVDVIECVQIAFDLTKILAFASKKNSGDVETIKFYKVLHLKEVLTVFDWLDTNKHLKGKSAIETEKLRNVFLITYQLLVELEKVLQSDLKYGASEDKAKELVQHIEQYIELIEIIEETSAVIRIDELQETANIARELRESFVMSEAIAQKQINLEKEIEISPIQTSLAQTLQKAVSSLQVQVLDYAQELAPALGKEILQRIAQVTARLQTDLVAVTGMQVAIQAPDVFLTKVNTMLEKDNSQVNPMSVTSDISNDDTMYKSPESSKCGKELEKKELFRLDSKEKIVLLTSLVATECVQTVSIEDVQNIDEKIIPYQEQTSQVEDIVVVATTDEALTEGTTFDKKEEQKHSKDLSEVQEKVTLEKVDTCLTQVPENNNFIETLRQHIKAYISDDVVEVIEKIVHLTNTDQLKQTISIAHELHNSISLTNVYQDGDGLQIMAQEQQSYLAKQLQVGLTEFQTLAFDYALQLQVIDQNTLLKLEELVTQLQDDLLLVANITENNTSLAPLQSLDNDYLSDKKKIDCKVAVASTVATQVDNSQLFDLTDVVNMEEASEVLVTKDVNILPSQIVLNELEKSNETFQVIDIENNVTVNIAQPLISDVITSLNFPVKQMIEIETSRPIETVLDQKEFKNRNLSDELNVTIKDQVLSALEVAPASCIVEILEKDTITRGNTDTTIQDKTSLELTLPTTNTTQSTTSQSSTVEAADINSSYISTSSEAELESENIPNQIQALSSKEFEIMETTMSTESRNAAGNGVEEIHENIDDIGINTQDLISKAIKSSKYANEVEESVEKNELLTDLQQTHLLKNDGKENNVTMSWLDSHPTKKELNEVSTAVYDSYEYPVAVELNEEFIMDEEKNLDETETKLVTVKTAAVNVNTNENYIEIFTPNVVTYPSELSQLSHEGCSEEISKLDPVSYGVTLTANKSDDVSVIEPNILEVTSMQIKDDNVEIYHDTVFPKSEFESPVKEKEETNNNNTQLPAIDHFTEKLITAKSTDEVLHDTNTFFTEDSIVFTNKDLSQQVHNVVEHVQFDVATINKLKIEDVCTNKTQEPSNLQEGFTLNLEKNVADNDVINVDEKQTRYSDNFNDIINNSESSVNEEKLRNVLINNQGIGKDEKLKLGLVEKTRLEDQASEIDSVTEGSNKTREDNSSIFCPNTQLFLIEPEIEPIDIADNAKRTELDHTPEVAKLEGISMIAVNIIDHVLTKAEAAVNSEDAKNNASSNEINMTKEEKEMLARYNCPHNFLEEVVNEEAIPLDLYIQVEEVATSKGVSQEMPIVLEEKTIILKNNNLEVTHLDGACLSNIENKISTEKNIKFQNKDTCLSDVLTLSTFSDNDNCHLLQHIEEFISPQVLDAVEQLSESISTEKLKESVAIAKELRETIAAVDVLVASEDTALVAEYAKEEQAKLAQNLQKSLSTLKMQVFESELEITSGIDPKTLELVSEVVAHLQDDLKTASISHTPEIMKVCSENVQDGGDENSMKKLACLLQEVSDQVNTTTTVQTLENTEELKDTLGEVQTVIIKLKRDGDGAGNDTLNETLEDLECSVRSVLLQINENSPPDLLKEACAALQLLANNMSEIKEVNITETISVKPEDVLTQCSVDAAETVKLLHLASKLDTKENSPLINIVTSLRTLKDILKSLRESFLFDSETLIYRGVDVMENLNQVEEKVFSLEKDLELEKNITSPLKENIVDAVHSVYGSISNMRSTICTIQKQYMYDNYGKPSECILKSLKRIIHLSKLYNEQVDACKWKKVSKSLRNVLSHFEDIKFYINLDKTARLPSDAGFTKVILNELKSNIVDVAPLVNSLSSTSTSNVDVMLQFLDKILSDLETKSSLEVRQKIPLFKQLATQVSEFTTNLISGLASNESNLLNKLDSIELERKHEITIIESEDVNNLLQSDNSLKEPLPSSSKVETISEKSLIDLSTSEQQDNLTTGKSIKKRDSKKKREEERRKQEEQARINQEKEETSRIKHDLSSQNVEDKAIESIEQDQKEMQEYELKENVNIENLSTNVETNDTNLKRDDRTESARFSKEKLGDMPEVEGSQSKVISDWEEVSNKEMNESQAKQDVDSEKDKIESAKPLINNNLDRRGVKETEEQKVETINEEEKLNSEIKQNAELVCKQKQKEEIRTETMQEQKTDKEAEIKRAIDVPEDSDRSTTKHFDKVTEMKTETENAEQSKSKILCNKEEQNEKIEGLNTEIVTHIKEETLKAEDDVEIKNKSVAFNKCLQKTNKEEASTAEKTFLIKENEEVRSKKEVDAEDATVSKLEEQEAKSGVNRESENAGLKKESEAKELCLQTVEEQKETINAEKAMLVKENEEIRIEKETVEIQFKAAQEEENRFQKEKETEVARLTRDKETEERIGNKDAKDNEAEELRQKKAEEEEKAKMKNNSQISKEKEELKNEKEAEEMHINIVLEEQVAKTAEGAKLKIEKEVRIEKENESQEARIKEVIEEETEIRKEKIDEDLRLKKENEAEELHVKKAKKEEEARKTEETGLANEKEAEELRVKKAKEEEEAEKVRLAKEKEAEELRVTKAKEEEEAKKAEEVRLAKEKEAEELRVKKAKEEEEAEKVRLAKEKEAEDLRLKKTREEEEARKAEEARLAKEKEAEELRVKKAKEEEEAEKVRLAKEKEAEELRVTKAKEEEEAKKAEEVRLAKEKEAEELRVNKAKEEEEAEKVRLAKEKEAKDLRLKKTREEEEARKAEEARLAKEKEAEELRVKKAKEEEEAEKVRLAKEKEAEDLRLKKARVEEEARKAEEARLAKEKEAEELRVNKAKEEEEAKKAEEVRLAKEKEAEELRVKKAKEEEEAEKVRLAKEKEAEDLRLKKTREEEEARKAEEARLAKEKEAEELRVKKAKEEEEAEKVRLAKEKEAEDLRLKKARVEEEARLAKEKEAEELRVNKAKEEEEARKAEEVRIAKDIEAEELRVKKAKEEEEATKAEEVRLAKEKKNEDLRLKKSREEEEARKTEELHVTKAKEEEEARKAEEARLAKEKEAEELRVSKAKEEEEASKAEEVRLAKEKEAEELRVKKAGGKEEARKAEELRVTKAKEEEEARKAEELRVTKAKEEEEARKAEAARLAKEKEAEESRVKKAREEEARKAEEVRLAKEKEAEDLRVKKARDEEEARKAEELRVTKAKEEEEAKKAEEARLAKEKEAEELRVSKAKEEEEARKAEELRVTKAKEEEEARKAKKARLTKEKEAEELRVKKAREEEEARKAEELRVTKAKEEEEARKAEEARLAKEKEAEESRVKKAREEEARKAEEIRLAKEKEAEDLRVKKAREAEEAKKAEELRVTNAKKEDEARNAEEVRLAKEKEAEKLRVKEVREEEAAKKAGEAKLAKEKEAEELRVKKARDEEARKADELRVTKAKEEEEVRKLEEARLAKENEAEELRVKEVREEEAAKKAGEAKLAKEKEAEELRVKKAREQEEARKVEELRAKKAKKEEEARKAEEVTLAKEKEAEELRVKKAKEEEEAKKAEEVRLAKEKEAEELRVKKVKEKEDAIKNEKLRVSKAKEEEEAKKTEEARLAKEKDSEELRVKKAGEEEEARNAEEARLTEEKKEARLKKELRKEEVKEENRFRNERKEENAVIKREEAEELRLKKASKDEDAKNAEEAGLTKVKEIRMKTERQDCHDTKARTVITVNNQTRNNALVENGDENIPHQNYETSRAKLQEPKLDLNLLKESQESISDYRNYKYDTATVRPKYDEREKLRFVDHDYKDYTMEFAKPSGYRERCFDEKSLLSERNSYGKSPMIYKAHTIVLDSQLRSSLPPISDVARCNDLEKRSEIRQRSKAISEARSVISEKRSSVPRDIKRKPVFSTYLTDRTAVEGSRVKLTCSVLSSGDPTITWYKNGIVLENKLKYKTKYVDGLITLEVLNAVPSDSAEYNCTVENENGSISSSANLKVYPSFEASPIPPTFTRSIRDTYHLAENELVLECRIRGQPLPTITWFKDDRLISNNERYQSYYMADGVCCLAICHPSPEDSGKYTCKAENSVWSDQITHIVNFTGQESRLSPNIATIERSRFNRAAMVSRRPHFGNVLTDYKVAMGGTIGLQVEIQGCPTRVEWLREGRSVIDIYGNARTFVEQGLYTLALSDVTEKESGMYTCRAWSTHGTVDMNAAITVVQPTEMEGRPAIIVGRPEKDVLISVGEDLNISFRVQGEPKPKVVFMKGIRDITNSQRVCKMTSDDYVKFTVKRSVVSDAGTYCILARNAYGCDRAFVTVVVRQRESSENLISDWTYPADDSAHSIVDRQYKCVPERVGSAPRVSDSGSGWVSLVWERAESRGAPVLAYRVDAWRLGADGGARWQQLGVTPLPSFDAFNLRAGDEYHFRVTPRNRHGWGEPVQTAVPVSVPAQLDRPDFVDALPGQLKVLVGDTAVLECTVRGRPHPDVIWMKNGHELEEPRAKVTFNGHRCRLTITDVCVDDDARYSCEASNAHGRTSTYARLAVVNDRMLYEADAKLKRERSLDAVGEYPPQFTMRLRDRRVQATYPVRLTCQVVGSPAPDVTWYKDGILLDNDDRHTVSVDEHFHTLEIAPTSLEDGGVYEALARNHRGAVSCRCSLLVDKGIRAYIAPEFCCGLEPLYRLNEGEELRISAVVEAYPSVGVTWYRDGVRLRPSRRAIMTLDHDGQIELALAAVTLRDQGVYSCTASNEVGSATTSGKLLVIGDDRPDKKPSPPVLIGPDVPYSAEPMFIRKPRSSEAREGDTVIIACEVVGDPKPDVYWLRDFLKPDYYRDAVHFRRVGGGPEYRFEIPHAKLDYTGAYSVLARNIHGEAKAVISLQILARDPNSTEEHNIRYGRVEVLPRFERELTDMLCYDGDAVELQCRVSGHPEPDLRWFHYNEVIRNSEEFELSYEDGTARLRIRQVVAEDEGTYICEASNTLGKASSTACLVVYPGGEPNTLRQRLRRPAALLSAASTPRSTPARSMSRTPAPEPRRACSPSRQMAPKFYTYPVNKVAEPGDCVVMQCAVRGLPVPWTTWDKDGIILTPNTRISIREKDDMLRILEIDNVTVEDVGVYRVTVENDFGRVEATARLEVVSGGRFHGALAPATTPRRRSVSRND